jgi:hypothetical protein
LPPERWLPCPAFEDHYRVSDRGRLHRVLTQGGNPVEKPVRPLVSTGGVVQVQLCVGGKPVRRSLAGLVALAFLGPPPSTGPSQVIYKNGNSHDCRATNLRWGSKADRMRLARRRGRFPGRDEAVGVVRMNCPRCRTRLHEEGMVRVAAPAAGRDAGKQARRREVLVLACPGCQCKIAVLEVGKGVGGP